MQHDLKLQTRFFEAVLNGTKSFELRENDRNFQVGDTLLLREYLPEDKSYTGRAIEKSITFMLVGEYGLRHNMACLSLGPINTTTETGTK